MAIFRVQVLTPGAEALVESPLSLAEVVAALQGGTVTVTGPAAPSLGPVPAPSPTAWPANADEQAIDDEYKRLTKRLDRPDAGEQYNHRQELANRTVAAIIADIQARFPVA